MSNNKQIRFSFRKGRKKDLPTHAPLGEPLFCTDTGELYVGMGNYQEIKKITDPDLVCKCENTGGGSSEGDTNIPPEVVENTYIIKTNNTLFHNNKVKMVAHRGLSSLATENTVKAFIEAGKSKYWGAECDICETKDGYFVVMHDETVDRTTNGTGTVASKTLSQIKNLKVDYGTNVDMMVNREVPTLEEYLDVCKQYGMIPIIELKYIKKESIPNFINVLYKYGLKSSCLIISFDKKILEEIKSCDEDLEVCYLCNFTQANIKYCESKKFHIGSPYTEISKELVQYCHSRDILVNAWTVDNSSDLERMIDMGVDIVTTNRLTRGDMIDTTIKVGRLVQGRHTLMEGRPIEMCVGHVPEDGTRRYTEEIYTINDATKVKVTSNCGLRVTCLFFDENYISYSDIGWLEEGRVYSIPSNAKYFLIYIGKSSEITEEDLINTRNINIVMM